MIRKKLCSKALLFLLCASIAAEGGIPAVYASEEVFVSDEIMFEDGADDIFSDAEESSDAGENPEAADTVEDNNIFFQDAGAETPIAKVEGMSGRTTKFTTEYATFEEALKAISEDSTEGVDSYWLNLRRDVTLTEDTILPDKKLILNIYGSARLIVPEGKSLTIQNDFTVNSAYLDMDKLIVKMASAGNHSVTFPAAAKGVIKSICDETTQEGQTTISISGNGS